MSSLVGYRRLGLMDMAAASNVFRNAFDARLPWLAGLHTPDEDRAFWGGHVFSTCEVWGAEQGHDLCGVIAFRHGWIEQLYVLPAAQGQGIGSRLLAIARAGNTELFLWTFQRNAGARRFYDTHGFTVVRETNGAENEEQELDMLYQWRVVD